MLDNSEKIDYAMIDLNNKDTDLKLVETIEELGFIPSVNKKDNNHEW